MERSGASITPKLITDPVFKLCPEALKTPSMASTFHDDEGLAKRVCATNDESDSADVPKHTSIIVLDITSIHNIEINTIPYKMNIAVLLRSTSLICCQVYRGGGFNYFFV
jgi:hypothetical protein